MSIRYGVMMAAALFISGNAIAEDGLALAKKGNCMNCHELDKKKVGPAFKDVAAKYKNDKGALATLEMKVRNGGGGVWGKIPMPASPKSLGDEDIKTLVQWVLSLK